MILLSIVGILKLKSLVYIIDELPKKSKIMKDLSFFQDNFKGIFPLDIIVDAGKSKSVIKQSLIEKIDSLENHSELFRRYNFSFFLCKLYSNQQLNPTMILILQVLDYQRTL